MKGWKGSMLLVVLVGAFFVGLSLTSADTLTFPPNGGDVIFEVKAPKDCIIVSASMDIEGGPSYSPVRTTMYTFQDPGHSAWRGSATDNPPSGGPDTLQTTPFTQEEIDAVKNEDGSTTIAIPDLQGMPYEHYQFTITEDITTKLTAKWVGFGIDFLWNLTGIKVYIWNVATSSWDLVGDYYDSIDNFGMMTIENSYSKASNYIDKYKKVSVLVEAIELGYFEIFGTDYVEITVTGQLAIYPKNVALDVGNNGIVEWSQPGIFKTKVSLGDDILKGEMQTFIDNSPAKDEVNIPFRFTSSTTGELKISGVNIVYDRPPVYTKIPSITFDEDTVLLKGVDLEKYFKDDWDDGKLKFEVMDVEPKKGVNITLNADKHSLDFTPLKDWNGVVKFKVKATDSRGLYAESDEITVTVKPVNDPPIIAQIGDRTAFEDELFELKVTAKDIDVGDVLIFSDDTRLFDISPQGIISFTPTNDNVGKYKIKITVRDKEGAEASTEFTLMVENVNDAPTIEPISDKTVKQGEEFELAVIAKDDDIKWDDKITFSDDTKLFNIDPTTGEIAFTPTNDDVGNYKITITVRDTKGIEAKAKFKLTIENVNDPPKLEEIGDIKIYEDEEWEYVLNGTDPDMKYGDKLTFKIDAKFIDIDEETGELSFTPRNEYVGVYKIKISVKDKEGLEAYEKIKLTVINTNDAPVNATIISPTSETSIKENEEVLLKGYAEDIDLGDELNFTWKCNDVVIATEKEARVKLQQGQQTILLEVTDGKEVVSAKVSVNVKKVLRAGVSKGLGIDAATSLFWLLPLIIIGCGICGFWFYYQKKKREIEQQTIPQDYPYTPSIQPYQYAQSLTGQQETTQSLAPIAPQPMYEQPYEYTQSVADKEKVQFSVGSETSQYRSAEGEYSYSVGPVLAERMPPKKKKLPKIIKKPKIISQVSQAEAPATEKEQRIKKIPKIVGVGEEKVDEEEVEVLRQIESINALIDFAKRQNVDVTQGEKLVRVAKSYCSTKDYAEAKSYLKKADKVVTELMERKGGEGDKIFTT